MANTDDKYPTASGRRRFVKGVVGASSLLTVGATGAVTVDSLTQASGVGGGTTQYFGIENTAGPAPRAMPMVPVEIDDEGFLRGVYPEVQEVERQGETVRVAEMELGGLTYSANWFQYCGVQKYEGLNPDYEGDDYFRYVSGGNVHEWQQDLSGNRVNVADFEDYTEWTPGIGTPGIGKSAKVTWRSQDTENFIPVEILRTERLADVIETADAEIAEWLRASTTQDFMAWLNKCTHFCCVPGFKSSTYEGAADKVYCPCHQSIYDPWSIVKKTFVAYARPEED